MGNKIGIDVGGTFTDVVSICENEIIIKGKIPTKVDDILGTILNALDYLDIANTKCVEHITVSTTLVTNAILQDQVDDVKLILFPGSGMKLTSLPWPVDYHVLSGELDYRGRVVVSPNKAQWQALAESLKKVNTPLVAIVSKFSHRNNIFEEELCTYLKTEIPHITIALGSQWGQTNFYRRSLTTYLNLASQSLFTKFSSQLQDALAARRCHAPVRVLKADGGVLPLDKIRPVESIYSGPAASILGALAQSREEESYVVVDIGGTTTDIGLVLSGSPLISFRGSLIQPYLTNVRSLAVRSIPVGGDSAVKINGREIMLENYRLGPAYCIGGENPTPTDAMRYLNLTDYGIHQKAEEALTLLVETSGHSQPQEIAESIIEKMVDRISTAIEQLLQEWKEEPAYKVWKVIHHSGDYKFSIHLSGGSAPGIAAALERRMKTRVIVTELAGFSNAIGAAMAKPTFSWTLNLDTNLARYRIEETGEQGIWKGSKKPHREAEKFLSEIAQNQAEIIGIEQHTLQTDEFDYFPLVDGHQTVGQIVRGSVHVPPGVTGRIKQ